MTKENESTSISKELLDSYGSQYRSKASEYNIGRTFINTGSNISVKSEYTRDDYDYYRGYESTIRSTYDNIKLSMRAYDKVGIVRNVIELMSDFVCKGIKLVHPVASQERFFQEWFQYVDGYGVSERFSNYLYRIANVPVNITYGTIPVKIEKKWSATKADIEVIDTKVEKRRIPLRYTFLNPLNIEVVEPELALFTGRPIYALRISTGILSSYNRTFKQLYMTKSDDEYGNYIPSFVLESLKKGQNIIPINNDNIRIYFYKRDDWKLWADSMIVPIMDDLIVLDKMKLADVSALDGAISTVRLWTLGHIGDSPQNSLIPTSAMINKVRNILANGIGGGTLDLVWGPDIKMQESSTNVHQFLGKAKYEPVLSQIYEGLGVPYGGDSAGSGMTNNFIRMQTFVERLQYGRRTLTNFWNEEIKRVQKAMGYKKPALVSFDQINLGDDSTYKTFLMNLMDRDAISVDSVLSNVGFFSGIEKIKIRKEAKLRENNKLPPKASPFHNPQQESEMRKILLQRGGVAPSEMGINLKERKDGDKSPNEQDHERQIEITDKNNEAKIQQQKFKPKNLNNGRPQGKKDSTKRKQKTAPLKTKGFVNMFLWGIEAQNFISESITPVLLENLYKKPNVRSLTTKEFEQLEATKLIIFSNLEPLTKITDDMIIALASKNPGMNPDVEYSIRALLYHFKTQNDREPTISEMRHIQSSGYALVYEEIDKNTEV